MKMQAPLLRSAVLAIVALSHTAGSAGAAVMLADFSTATNPVQGWGVSSLGFGVPPVAGTGNWGDVTVQQYWGQLTIPNWATGDLTIASLNSNNHVDFDLIFPSSGWLAGTAEIELSVGTDGSVVHSAGWTTYDISSIKDQVVHFSIDYSSFGLLPDSVGVDLSLNFKPAYNWMWDGANPDGVPYTPQRFQIDNIALTSVPEPAVSVIGLMGALLVLRGRRR